MAFTSFSAGNLIKSSEVNANYNETLKGQCDNALLNTTSIDVQGIVGSPFKIVDLFTDSTGDNNTVSTGDTTAEYYATSDYYRSAFNGSSTVLEPGFETVASWTYSEVDTLGKYTGGQSTDWATEGTNSYRLRVATSSANIISGEYAKVAQTVDFTNINMIRFDYKTVKSGTGAWFTLTGYIGATRILIRGLDEDTTSFVEYDCSAISGNQSLYFQLSCISSEVSVTLDNKAYIDNIETDFADAFIQSVDTNVGTGFNSAYIRPKLYKAIPSGADITCYVSLDGGSTWTAESNINEIIDLSALSDTGHLVVKLNLNTDTTVTAKASGWCCVLFE